MTSFQPMTSADKAAFLAAQANMCLAGQPVARATLNDKPLTKAESARLGKALLGACAKGDSELALTLLGQGALPNARDANGQSILEIALERCGKGVDMHDFTIAALEKGARVAPAQYGGLAGAFAHWISTGTEASDELKAECSKLTLEAFCQYSQHWRAVARAFEILRPDGRGMDAMTMLALRGRIALMAEGARMGVRCSANTFDALMNRASLSMGSDGHDPLIAKDSLPHLSTIAESLASSGQLGAQATSQLYDRAARAGSPEALMLLMRLGAMPSPEGWTGRVHWMERVGYRENQRSETTSLLIAAAASPFGRLAFDALAQFPPALDHARANRPAPHVLALIPIARLLDLAALGVDISKQDAIGGLAHWWAQRDEKPRDGWATLAAKAPQVFETPNERGVKAADAMAAKLSGKELDAFTHSLARIESREIKKVAKAPKASKTPSARPRL